MNIITVIPLSRQKGLDRLSYFTAQDIPVGAIVSVPVRSKSVHALVIETKPAENLKSEIKSAPYEIRKLSKVRATTFFPASFVDACTTIAHFYATGLGSVIDALVSNVLLENSAKIPPPLPVQSDLWNGTGDGPKFAKKPDETYTVQGDTLDRMSTWRSLIRQEFARKRSIAIYVPAVEEARAIFNALQKGIEGYIFVLHGSLTEKKILETWKSIAETGHPVVVIATGSFSVLPRGDIDTVIIERENGRGWIGQKTPYLDMRYALETIARRQRQTVYLADSLLRTETLKRLDGHEIAEASPFKWRSISDARDMLVDMRRDKKQEAGSTEKGEDAGPVKFRVLSKELEDLIQMNRENSAHLFILAIRRGSSPITVCGDCEALVSCYQCSAPMVLHTSKESGRNFFMCHKCGERRSADESCKICNSWRLVPLGIGIDRVEEEIRAKFPDIDIFKIDADSTKTEKQVSDVLEKFNAKPGSILIGTEMALSHLGDSIDHVAVASLDSLFALPDFRIQEKVMYLLVRLRAIASRTFLVQTRRPEERAFEFGLKGNLSDFYRTTLAERKQFAYPPFSVLVKITLEGKKDQIAEGMAEIQKQVAPYEIDVFPAFTATVRGKSVIHGLIKVEAGRWPDAELIRKLRELPIGASIKVNPESLL